MVKGGIDQTVLYMTLVWLLLPFAWNKTDTNFIMSDLFWLQVWNRSDSPVLTLVWLLLPRARNKTDNSFLVSFLICLLNFSSPNRFHLRFYLKLIAHIYFSKILTHCNIELHLCINTYKYTSLAH